MRFENIDDDPEPKDIRIAYSAWGDEALRVPHYANPMLSVAQEPSLVRLPDERLFCVMRTMSGYIWYSLSNDDGLTWCNPRPLLRRDHGLPILEPLFAVALFTNTSRAGTCCSITTMTVGSMDASRKKRARTAGRPLSRSASTVQRRSNPSGSVTRRN